MPEPLLHRQQRILTRIDQHQPPWIQPRAGEPGREEVLPAEDPQHRSWTTRQQASSEQCRGGTLLDFRAAARNLMHRSERHPARREVLVDNLDAERQHARRPDRAAVALDGCNLRAQGCQAPMFHRILPLVPLPTRT